MTVLVSNLRDLLVRQRPTASLSSQFPCSPAKYQLYPCSVQSPPIPIPYRRRFFLENPFLDYIPSVQSTFHTPVFTTHLKIFKKTIENFPIESLPKMGRFRRYEIIEHSPSVFLKETSIFAPRPSRSLLLNPCFNFPSFPFVEDELHLDCTLDLLTFPQSPSLLLDDLDLIQIDETPFHTRRVTRRVVGLGDLHLEALSDRVSALELGLARVLREEKCARKKAGERKYSWTAEIKSPEKDRKYKWEAEKKGVEKSYKWTAEIKRKGEESPIEQTYTIKVSTGGKSEEKEKKKGSKGKEKEKTPRIVEIEEPSENGGIVLRQVFAKRADKIRGKRKELSLQDATLLIQRIFRAYLIRRSQALRALRELAIAKSKLKEIRALFNNFSYRRRLIRDAEECQKFSERIIVLLLTVDAIEGADIMVRAAKKTMVDELEAMLDVIDPQPAGKSLLKRRTFDMPDATINKELAAGVAQVVRMLDEEATSSEC